MSDEIPERIKRYRVRGKGFLVDSGILVDSGVFVDSCDATRYPILLLDWPVEWPKIAGGPPEVICLQEPISIRSTDDDGEKAVSILNSKVPLTVRRIGTDEETGLPLYEHVSYPYVLPLPEYLTAGYRFNLKNGEVSLAAFFEFGHKADGCVRFEGVDYKVIVLDVDGSGVLRENGEYLQICEDNEVLPIGAIFFGHKIGETEFGLPVFEGVPAKLPVKRPKKRNSAKRPKKPSSARLQAKRFKKNASAKSPAKRSKKRGSAKGPAKRPKKGASAKLPAKRKKKPRRKD